MFPAGTATRAPRSARRTAARASERSQMRTKQQGRPPLPRCTSLQKALSSPILSLNDIKHLTVQ